jgi:hypothetical protein
VDTATTGEAEPLRVAQLAYDLARDLVPAIHRFPRDHRFTLGERLEGALLDLALALRRIALCRVLGPVIERTLVADTYACRIGKGPYRALDRVQRHLRASRWVLAFDIAKFFPSIDHAILRRTLARHVKDVNVLRLCGVILDGSPPPPADVPAGSFPGDDLFTPVERRRGLPINANDPRNVTDTLGLRLRAAPRTAAHRGPARHGRPGRVAAVVPARVPWRGRRPPSEEQAGGRGGP